MQQLILVTHNKGKLREANRVARRYGISLSTPKYIGKFEIQSDSLAEISEYAAKEAYKHIKKPLLVDDTGMFIHALNDFPGVYTSHALERIGNGGLLKLMDGIKNRSADSKCALSFYDGKTFRCFVGRMDGSILRNQKGNGGFGFDSIFSPKGYKGKSLAELGMDDKNRVSHRGKAFEAFFRWYSNEKKKC